MEGRNGPRRPPRVFDLLGAAERVQQGVALPAHLLHAVSQGDMSKTLKLFSQSIFRMFSKRNLSLYVLNAENLWMFP